MILNNLFITRPKQQENVWLDGIWEGISERIKACKEDDELEDLLSVYEYCGVVDVGVLVGLLNRITIIFIFY